MTEYYCKRSLKVFKQGSTRRFNKANSRDLHVKSRRAHKDMQGYYCTTTIDLKKY